MPGPASMPFGRRIIVTCRSGYGRCKQGVALTRVNAIQRPDSRTEYSPSSRDCPMPMTDSERSEIESLINRRRIQLTREIESGVERTRDNSFDAVAGEAPDAGDEALASLVADTENAETRRDMRELQELDAALT